MLKKIVKLPEEPIYQFLRSKDTHEENGITFITLFYRLTRESLEQAGETFSKKVETVYAEIEELKQEYANDQIRATANEMHQYTISKEIFLGLHGLAQEDPKKLYLLTPMYQKAQRQRLLPRLPVRR